MNDEKILEFLKINNFAACPERSIPETGMSSKVDVFINGDVLIRVVMDRGQRFVDIARLGEDIWIDVFSLAKKVDPTFIAKRGSFSEAVLTLTKYWPQIVTSLP